MDPRGCIRNPLPGYPPIRFPGPNYPTYPYPGPRNPPAWYY